MYKVELTTAVKRDIAEAYNYISQNLYNEEAAKNLLVEIEKKINGLKDFAEMHPLARDEFLSAEGIRAVRIKNYLLFYQLIDNTVFVLRFLYGRRNWASILKHSSEH